MWKNVSLLLFSVVFSVLVGEAALRFALDPADFLNPVLTRHPQFNTRIYPNSAGHDKWGFRNASVPPRADLVAIGDSFTYGYLAAREKSWPSFVSQRTGLSTYNISMGGWGPSQYVCAMKVYGRSLRPKSVVVAIFLGNDIQQAAVDESQCSILDPEKIEAGYEVVEVKEQRVFDRARTWLSHNSMFYQVVKASVSTSTWLSNLTAFHRDDLFVAPLNSTTAVLRPNPLTDDQSLQKGIAATIDLLRELLSECENIGARCYTLLVPSKENVYSQLLGDAIPENAARSLRKIREHEQNATKAIVDEFTNSRMVVMNSEDRLREAVRSGKTIYPVSPDAHLNETGYKILGLAVVDQLRRYPDDSVAGM